MVNPSEGLIVAIVFFKNENHFFQDKKVWKKGIRCLCMYLSQWTDYLQNK